MKTTKIVYWISTVLVAVMMLFTAYLYITSPDLKQAFVHLGFPDYFRVELAIAKIIGVAVLLVPFKGKLKEWAYAGFSIVFVSALIAHIASGDAFVMPLVFLVILAVSYISYSKLDFAKQNNIVRAPVLQ